MRNFMNTELFIDKLSERFRKPLPGLKAQLQMAPISRIISIVNLFKTNKPKKSSVLILLFLKEDKLHFVLTQRHEYNGVHSGQICLPGGKYEDTDDDLYHTAIREAQEEINVEPTKIEKIGELTKLYTPPSNYCIQPFVGFTKNEPNFIKQPEEVKEIILTDLIDFIDNPIKGTKPIRTNRNITISAPYYEIGGYTVWGATAMILSEFYSIAKEVFEDTSTL